MTGTGLFQTNDVTWPGKHDFPTVHGVGGGYREVNEELKVNCSPRSGPDQGMSEINSP